MNKNQIESVLSSVKDNIDPNYIVIKSIEVDSGSITKIDFDVDSTISYVKVTVSGQNPRVIIKNPSNGAASPTKELSLASLKITDFKNPQKGTWNMDVAADSAFTVIISAQSSLSIDYGFSLQPIAGKSQSDIQPLAGTKNILTLFLSDVSNVKDMQTATIVTIPTSSSERPQKTTMNLIKIKDGVYATDSIDIPNKLFKIKAQGHDKNAIPIKRIISSALTPSPGSKYLLRQWWPTFFEP
jgi:hypothetical protein